MDCSKCCARQLLWFTVSSYFAGNIWFSYYHNVIAAIEKSQLWSFAKKSVKAVSRWRRFMGGNNIIKWCAKIYVYTLQRNGFRNWHHLRLCGPGGQLGSEQQIVRFDASAGFKQGGSRQKDVGGGLGAVNPINGTSVVLARIEFLVPKCSLGMGATFL